MLSFQPMPIDTSNTAIAPTAKPQANPTKSKPPVTQQQAYTEPDLIPKQTQKVAESAPISKSEKTTPEVEKTVDINNALPLNSANWLDVTARLKLTAFSRQLADNASFVSLEDKTISLAIAPEFAHLANDKAISRLQSALSTELQYDVKLRVQQDETQQASPTLATERAEQSKLSQQNAKNAIHNDPAVAALKSAFNAEIIESTIKPI
jgi:DNA polymerase-3 subunit gamma/tau